MILADIQLLWGVFMQLALIQRVISIRVLYNFSVIVFYLK